VDFHLENGVWLGKALLWVFGFLSKPPASDEHLEIGFAAKGFVVGSPERFAPESG
jgi:hypothetical protein